eukprot:g20593.t1
MIGLQVENYRLYGGGATRNGAGARVHGVLALVREDIVVEDVSCRENSRIVRVTTPGAFGRKVHFVAAYAPTDAAPTAEKRRLYKQLQAEVNVARGHGEVIIGGDMNAEAGEVQHELIAAGLPYSVGKCGMTPGFAVRSENSRLFADFLAENQLLTVSSIFRKEWAARWTFKGSFEGGRRLREYDHLLARHRDRGQATGFEVVRETHTESDHRMVSMQWASAGIQKRKRDRPAYKAKERTKAFADEMDAYYRECGAEQRLDELAETATAAELWEEFEERTKKILEGIKADAEERTKRKQRIAGKARKPPQDLPGEPGVHEKFWKGVLGEERPEAPEELRSTATWRRCQQHLDEGTPAAGSWPVEKTGPPTAGEVAAAVRGLKRGRSYAGLLPAEFFAGSKLAGRILYEVVQKIFRGDEIPPRWLEAAITLLHKGGKKADPGNYRPVALLTVGEKLLALVILNRIKDEAYGRIDKRQKGSVRGMSCRHAVFQLLRDMEHAVREEECAIYTFIDFRKAYDSLDWKRMRDILRRMGMPEELGRIVEAVYGGATYALRLGQDRTTDAAKQKSGIRQGSSLSPLLFILCLDFAMRNFCRTMVEEKGWTHEEAL